MTKPIILQILPSLETGGVERGTVEITEAITRAGWDALVASAGGRMVAEIDRAGGRHVALDLTTRNPLRMMRNVRALARLIANERVNIVHARSRAPGWSAFLAARRAGAHFVTTYHGAYSEDLPLKRRYNAVMAKGELVIVASRFIAELVERRHGVDPARIRLIPRGVDPNIFDPAIRAERAERLRHAWGLANCAPVIMLPGRLTGWKGQGTLIDAAARLAHYDAQIVLVGSDQGRRAYADGLRSRAAALGLADRLHLVGECADMPAALMLADVVIHASTAPEAFGRVVIEAQAMGRPVIAADLGGPVETVLDGATGWRVPPGDPAALAAALDRVLALPDATRRAVGARAREAVLARCTKAAMQSATLDVYREVLAAPVA